MDLLSVIEELRSESARLAQESEKAQSRIEAKQQELQELRTQHGEEAQSSAYLRGELERLRRETAQSLGDADPDRDEQLEDHPAPPKTIDDHILTEHLREVADKLCQATEDVRVSKETLLEEILLLEDAKAEEESVEVRARSEIKRLEEAMDCTQGKESEVKAKLASLAATIVQNEKLSEEVKETTEDIASLQALLVVSQKRAACLRQEARIRRRRAT
mmetsp:Transcript_10487/g.39599  ORF Transcript_10487/g.39599 Transcript_10487/m.39599 type:complete len:218 (-) Transcript_10487:174-827(-)|eukprot:scaffold770_cov255-Pinguiococcus_pyrenoidosus.AAC.35